MKILHLIKESLVEYYDWEKDDFDPTELTSQFAQDLDHLDPESFEFAIAAWNGNSRSGSYFLQKALTGGLKNKKEQEEVNTAIERSRDLHDENTFLWRISNNPHNFSGKKFESWSYDWEALLELIDSDDQFYIFKTRVPKSKVWLSYKAVPTLGYEEDEIIIDSRGVSYTTFRVEYDDDDEISLVRVRKKLK